MEDEGQEPQLDSDQERLIAEFMRRSFGASFIFAPKNFKKENGQEKEACDIFIIVNNVVFLFYLKSGRKPPEKQIAANAKQFRNFSALWRTGRKEYRLTGKNNFGNIAEIDYSDQLKIVFVSVISHETGVSLIPHQHRLPNEIWISIPEFLLHALKMYRATCVDLLIVVRDSLIEKSGNTQSLKRIVS
jgi:hypothetical protein